MKATLVVPRSELPKAVTDLSEFDMFHVSEEHGSPSDPHLADLALRSYKLFIDLDEILRELNVHGEAGLIQTLMKGPQKIETKKFRAEDWADFVTQLEADAKPMIEEFKSIVSERSTLQKQIEENQAQNEAFAMLSRLSVDLDTMRSLRLFHLVFSVVSTKDLKEVGRSLPDTVFVSTPLTRDKSAVLMATPRAEGERVEKVLRSFDIRPFEILENLPQNPTEAYKAVSGELKRQIDRLQEVNDLLNTTLDKPSRTMLSLREGAKTANDVLTGIKKVGDLKRFAVVKGFFPADRRAEFEEMFGGWILFTEDVEHGGHESEEEAPSTPVIMKNVPFIRAFETITLNQGPPKYGELDPTPFITFTFPIFYGIMFGDFGHGVILTLFGLLLYRRGDGSMRRWGVMLTVAGLSAAAVGLMIGEIFGFAIGEIIPGLGHPLLEVVERAHGVTSFNSEAITTVLQVSILIGIAHLTIGFGLAVFKAFKEKEYVEVYTDKLPTFVMYVFGIVFALAFIGAGTSFSGLLEKQDPIPLLGLPVAQATAISLPIILLSVVALIAGKPVAILLKKAPKDSIGMSLMMGIVEFLIRIVEFLANTVSYARLGILLLVHAALLMVLNRVVSLPLAVAVPMLIVFNILIMMLEGLIVYIQDLRLHLYEWFTKFYEGTGLLFRRMKPEPTYFEIEWEQNPNSASTSEEQS